MARSRETPRRLAGHVLWLSAVVSLLGGVAVAILWARSHQSRVPVPASYFNIKTGSYAAVRIRGGAERSWFAATRPGRVLFVEQSYRRGVGVRGVDVSHCGVLFSNINGAGRGYGIDVHRDSRHSVLGFDIVAREQSVPGVTSGNMAVFHYTIVAVPFWVLLACTSILPALWVGRSFVRLRRAWRGRCLRCGYDVRESAVGSACPECGTIVPDGPRVGRAQ